MRTRYLFYSFFFAAVFWIGIGRASGDDVSLSRAGEKRVTIVDNGTGHLTQMLWFRGKVFAVVEGYDPKRNEKGVEWKAKPSSVTLFDKPPEKIVKIVKKENENDDIEFEIHLQTGEELAEVFVLSDQFIVDLISKERLAAQIKEFKLQKK